MKKCVDIIIPVYNALEDLKLCVDSIKKHTNLKLHRLLLLNDKSSDVNVWPYLESLREENIFIFNNNTNLGFSGNINKGISFSNNDVILLNSDTIVTAHWVEKMIKCAYSDCSIGTVTPLSNNATIYSIPDFCEENKIPAGYSIDTYAALVESCSMREYPKTPVAHGFCMYIKREVFQKIGLFDAKTFERGYGEENDFCNRASQIGYTHVLCDDTYIYHSGTSSFQSDEKLRYIEAHERILSQRYPRQTLETSLYCSENPNAFIAENVNIFAELGNGKKNILYVLQSDFRMDSSDHVGGVQLHVKDLTNALKEKYNIFVAARNDNFLNLTAYTKNKTFYWKFPIDMPTTFPMIRNKKIGELCTLILKEFNINLVHIHHVLNLSFEIFYAAHNLHLPIIATVHDYYFVCPNVKLLNSVKHVCIKRETDDMCKACLQKHFGISETVSFIPTWRQICREVLGFCKTIIVPSENTKNNFNYYYPELKDKIMVIDHGSDLAESHSYKKAYKTLISEDVYSYLDEGYVMNNGNLYLRGWAYCNAWNAGETEIIIEVFCERQFACSVKGIGIERPDVANGNPLLLKSGFTCVIPSQYYEGKGEIEYRILLKRKKDIITNGKRYRMSKKDLSPSALNSEFHVAFVGGLSVEKGAILAYEIIKSRPKNIHFYILGDIGYQPLRKLEQKNLTKLGRYSRDELGDLIQHYSIDLICILSIWPETFCYTLSEAVLAKVPVIATDIGAISERLQEIEPEVLVPLDSKEILKRLRYIQSNPNIYQKLQEKLSCIQIRSIADMSEEYSSLYMENLIDFAFKKTVYGNRLLMKYLCVGNGLSTDEYGDKLWYYKQKEAELEAIKNATTYKFMKSLDYIKIPFRNQIKYFIEKRTNE